MVSGKYESTVGDGCYQLRIRAKMEWYGLRAYHQPPAGEQEFPAFRPEYKTSMYSHSRRASKEPDATRLHVTTYARISVEKGRLRTHADGSFLLAETGQYPCKNCVRRERCDETMRTEKGRLRTRADGRSFLFSHTETKHYSGHENYAYGRYVLVAKAVHDQVSLFHAGAQ